MANRPDPRRRHTRYPGTLTIQVERDGVRRFGTIFEVSRGGAYIDCNPPPPPGTPVKIHFARTNGATVTFPAEVRYQRHETDYVGADYSGIGIAWGELDDAQRAYLDELIARAAGGKTLRE